MVSEFGYSRWCVCACLPACHAFGIRFTVVGVFGFHSTLVGPESSCGSVGGGGGRGGRGGSPVDAWLFLSLCPFENSKTVVVVRARERWSVWHERLDIHILARGVYTQQQSKQQQAQCVKYIVVVSMQLFRTGYISRREAVVDFVDSVVFVVLVVFFFLYREGFDFSAERRD